MDDSQNFTLDQANEIWAMLPKNQDTALMLTNYAKELPEDERRKLLHGKSAEIKQAIWERKRASAYEINRAARLGMVLQDLGLLNLDDGWTNKSTGRKCKSRVIELARLGWDWQSEQTRTWLQNEWGKIAAMPLDTLKATIRKIRGRTNPERRDLRRKQIIAHVNAAIQELDPEDARQLAQEIITSLQSWLDAE